MHSTNRLSFILAGLAAAACFSGPVLGAITNGLAGHWKFDETSGQEAADASGNGHAAVIANFLGDAPGWAAGKIGNGLVFRGPDNGGDFAAAQDVARPGGAFTVSAWARADDRAVWPQSAIVESGLNGSGPIGLVIRNKNVDQAFGPLGETTTTANSVVAIQDTSGFPTGVWQHVAAVANGSQIKLYRNGGIVASAPYTGALGTAPGPFLGIGGLLDESGNPIGGYWQGMIDDVGVWTNALSDAEVSAIFVAGQAGKDLSQADAYLVSPPSVATQPKNLTRYAGESAIFSVVAAGTAPFAYHWKRNDTAIPGATNASHTVRAIAAGDAGAYTVSVSNSAGTATSEAATLTVNAADFSTGLIGYWRFDETAGDAGADASPGGHPAELTGFADDSKWVAGRVGKALQVNGANGEFGHVSDYEKPTSTITASAWVWADGRGQWATFLKNWGDVSAGQFHFGLFTDGRENIYIKQSDGKTPNVSDLVPLPTNSWQHVAFVCDGSFLRLYRNGAEVAVTPYDGTLVTPPMNCIGIGSKLADNCETPAASATGPWQGKLDEVALWKRGLSSREIYALFKAGEEGKGLPDAAGSLPTQPLITRQPVSVSVFENGLVTLSASATGAEPLTYQWLKDGQAVEGANASALSLGRVTMDGAGSYRLRVSNPAGSAESDLAVVAVNVRPPATLVSEWKFEDNLSDTSGHGNEGTAIGTVEYVAGRFGKAVRLAPGNPIMKENANDLPLSRTNSWSINLWVNLAEQPTSLAYLAGFGPVLNTGGGTGRGLLAFSGPDKNNILFWGNGNDQGSNSRYPTNRWAMITIAYAADERAATLFLDGAQIATGIRNLADIPAEEHRISLAPTSNWAIDVGGQFDEFSVWSGVLLASQIAALYDPTGGPVELTAKLNGSKLALSWAAGALGYTLESTGALGSGSWVSVAGVANNSVEVDLTGSGRFFRLKK